MCLFLFHLKLNQRLAIIFKFNFETLKINGYKYTFKKLEKYFL